MDILFLVNSKGTYLWLYAVSIVPSSLLIYTLNAYRSIPKFYPGKITINR